MQDVLIIWWTKACGKSYVKNLINGVIKKKILLSEEEYEDLKELLDYGYYYIARDKNDTLCAYEEYPRKNEHDACWSDDISVSPLGNDHFKFIKWEDEEPTLIADLLKEK